MVVHTASTVRIGHLLTRQTFLLTLVRSSFVDQVPTDAPAIDVSGSGILISALHLQIL